MVTGRPSHRSCQNHQLFDNMVLQFRYRGCRGGGRPECGRIWPVGPGRLANSPLARPFPCVVLATLPPPTRPGDGNPEGAMMACIYPQTDGSKGPLPELTERPQGLRWRCSCTTGSLRTRFGLSSFPTGRTRSRFGSTGLSPGLHRLVLLATIGAVTGKRIDTKERRFYESNEMCGMPVSEG